MSVNFQPDDAHKQVDAPYFEDVSGDAGYRGQGTHKSIDSLLSECTNAIANLGGFIVNVQRGKFTDERGRSRPGFVFVFTMAGPGNKGQVMTELKIAAFPLRTWSAKKEEQAKKMALYVIRDWLTMMFNFQKMNPTPVAPLIFAMLDKHGQTLSDAWIAGNITQGLLLPGSAQPPDSDLDVVEGEAE